MITNRISGLPDVGGAVGLTPHEAEMCSRLYATWSQVQPRNERRWRYYCDEQGVKNLGLTVPDSIAGEIDTKTGWCEKAVDMLANRSSLDSIDATDELARMQLEAIDADNRISASYDMAKASELIVGCAFAVAERDDSAASGVRIMFRDGYEASAIYDYRNQDVEAVMIVADKRDGVPCEVAVYTADARLDITLDASGSYWTAVRNPHGLGRVPAVFMAYKPTNRRPFGRSRITRACMATVDEMQREKLRAAIHSECYAAPQKYVLGADKTAKSKFELYMDSLLTIGPNENGDLPQVGQFAQASMQPHIELMDKLAENMASITSLPVESFGVISKGYTSETARRAACDDIILEANEMNSINGEALVKLARIALAIANETTYAEIVKAGLGIRAHWRSTSLPSISVASDAMCKQAAVATWLPNTRFYWESLGFTAEQIDVLENQREGAISELSLNAALFGNDKTDN